MFASVLVFSIPAFPETTSKVRGGLGRIKSNNTEIKTEVSMTRKKNIQMEAEGLNLRRWLLLAA